MMASLKPTRSVALFASALLLAFTTLIPHSYAGTAAPQQSAYQTKTPSVVFVAGKLKTPGKGARVQCNGKTTSECCSGIAFCGCLYAPGSDDNHPTSCHSSPPAGN